MINTIVYVYDQAYISGGAAKIAINAAAALKKRGYRVIYFAAVGPVDDQLKNSGVEVICIGGEHIGKTKNAKALIRGIWNRLAKKKLNALLSTLNPNSTVVHIHGWTKALSASIFDACKKNNMKTFITLHEYFTVCANGGIFDYQKEEICACKPNSLRCFFCNCDKRNYIQKMYRNIRQIFTNYSLNKNRPNAIYITKFSKNILQPYIKFSDNNYLVENHVEIPANEKIAAEKNKAYLFIGRMSAEKSPHLFCEAVNKAKVQGIVIGDGPQFNDLKTKYPNIKFTGWLNSQQLKEYIKQARCLVVTSKWYETMGLTIIEMQSSGIPCIVPDKCAGREYIKDGVTGLLYKIGDLDTLIEKLDLTKNDNYVAALSNAFYNTFDENRFSMKRHIENLIKVYNQ